MSKNIFTLRGEVWLYPSDVASWHFVTLPKKESENIKATYGAHSPGWGSLPVSVTLGTTTWKTSIFPDKHSGGYLLPLKATVRAKERIRQGDNITFTLEVLPKLKKKKPGTQ